MLLADACDADDECTDEAGFAVVRRDLDIFLRRVRIDVIVCNSH